jgi:hypothetical protein
MSSVTPPSSSNEEEKRKYVCIYCGTPCVAIYRQLSTSLSSIKALNCPECYQIIDPYIEREWLLVVIDCILLRPEAYRHVLYNADKDYFDTIAVPRAVQLIVASSILHTYLKWETIRRIVPAYEDISNTTFIVSLLVNSLLDFLVQWTTIYVYLMKIYDSKTDIKRNVANKLFWSLILPTTFNVVCIFVLIWENSRTIKALGSLLIACWQSLAVSTISNHNNRVSRVVAPMVGITSLMIWRLIVSMVMQRSGLFVTNTTSPVSHCIGFELDFFFFLYNQGAPVNKPFPPLCLT